MPFFGGILFCEVKEMIIPFSTLSKRQFTVTDINVIRQRPAYRLLRIDGRRYNGFICIIGGSCTYKSEGGEFLLTPGSVAYVPFSSRHTLEIAPDGVEFYRVDFTLKIDGEIALFSEYPIKITDGIPKECLEAVKEICDNFGIFDDYIMKTEKICTVFRALGKASGRLVDSRLEPAVNYINEHLTEHIDCKALSALCFLSTSQFYALFKSELGITPLGYRDRLLVERAKAMLESDGVSISETATALGFESAAYFSRFFKKCTGETATGFLERSRDSLLMRSNGAAVYCKDT